jgi:poly-gamma-glutamate capsule biosynthesis protein CapA/YwtB (metallophosphatase superfamily)
MEAALNKQVLCFVSLLLVGVLAAPAAAQTFGPADPVVINPSKLDPKRPLSQELATNVPDGFTVATVGDLIISRPMLQYASTQPAFNQAIDLVKGADVAYGNMESTIFDARYFQGYPYSWDGDWTNASLPSVAADLKNMGFDILSRANNHAMDWGLEGMRETSKWLDSAGLIHAGAGENKGIARAPQYWENPMGRGRVGLVSFATTYRPTTDALDPKSAAPGRAGLSALGLTQTVNVTGNAMAGLAQASCAMYGTYCGQMPSALTFNGTAYRLATEFSYTYDADPDDLAEIYRNIRDGKENSDLLIVAVHSHECSKWCDNPLLQQLPGLFLKNVARASLESGGDVFVTTGIHNLGPMEIYNVPNRGFRPIFYGLGNFFWSDIQMPLPEDLFAMNSGLLSSTYQYPVRATQYDLTAPLNKSSFASDFYFQSVIAVSLFSGKNLKNVTLYPVQEGYGDPLTISGLPRRVADKTAGLAIVNQIVTKTTEFGLPPPKLQWNDALGAAVVVP